MTESKRLAAVAGLLLTLALAACGERGPAVTQASTPAVVADSEGTSTNATSERSSRPVAAPSPALGAIPSGTAALKPGTYRMPRSTSSAVDFTVVVPQGWTVRDGYVLTKHPDAPEEFRFRAHAPDRIYVDACSGDGARIAVGPSVDDLVAALLDQAGTKVSAPVATTLGGYPARRIDLAVPHDLDLKACRLEGTGLQVWFSHATDDYLVLVPDSTASVYIVDVDGLRQVFLTEHRSATSVDELRELQDLLDSIHIET